MTDNTPKVNPQDLLEMSSQIVSAHVSNNTISVADIPVLIQQVYQTLASVDANRSKDFDRPQPAVPVKKSVTDEHIVCLEDGKKLKMLKRHLKSSYNMTPEQYRERWGLSADYPMVAPNYAKKRSSLAMEIGLGRKRKAA